MATVVDVDDNLLEVPSTIDPKGDYASYRPFFDRLLRSAAAVTVATPALQQLYARQSRQVVLMPNLLSRRLWGLPVNRQPAEPGRVAVLYMGTKTHDADLAMVMPAFAALAAGIPGLRLRVVGGFAAVRADRPEWLEVVPLENAVKGYPDFVPWLRGQVAPVDFAIAPLVDTPFNRWKSGLKFLDYAALGLSGLFSDLPEYRQMQKESGTGTLVRNPEDWLGALAKALDDVPALRAQGRKAREWVVATKLVPDQTGSGEDSDELAGADPGRIRRQ